MANRQLVPEAKAGLYKFKMETEKVVGINFTDYNVNLT
ncbi:small, acid-soluble spore protein, alpha/beta type [Clostridium estertheticum]|nr:small, acid-soluble spore protein, alpha/beta type [Clostridium estertheticum]